MCYKYVLIVILATSSLSHANQDHRKLVQGELQHSFVDGEYISFDGRTITIFDGAELDDSQQKYLSSNINSGLYTSVLVRPEAIKASWSYEVEKASKEEVGKSDQLVLNRNLSFFLGTKLFSWQEDYYIIQVGNDLYHLLSEDLSDAEKMRVRRVQYGEKFSMLVNSGSVIPLIDSALLKELKTLPRKEYSLIHSGALIIVGKVNWFPSQQIGSVQSRGYVFIFDKKSLENSHQKLLDMHGKNITLRVPSEDILAIFNNEGLVGFTEFLGQKNKMKMIAR